METIQSPIGRISWPFVFGAGDEQEDGPSKYKVTLMLPKNKEAFKTLGINPAQAKSLLKQVTEFVEVIRAEGEAAAKAQFKGKWSKSRHNPVLDGDEKAEKWEGNANFWLLRCKTKYKPKVGKPKAEDGLITDGDIDEQTGFYPGCWARVAVSLYTYNVKGKTGVGLGLSYVQKAWNDEAFQTGGFEFEDDIEELDIDESDVEEFDDAVTEEDEFA